MNEESRLLLQLDVENPDYSEEIDVLGSERNNKRSNKHAQNYVVAITRR